MCIIKNTILFFTLHIMERIKQNTSLKHNFKREKTSSSNSEVMRNINTFSPSILMLGQRERYEDLFDSFFNALNDARNFEADMQQIDIQDCGCDIQSLLSIYNAEHLKSCQKTFLRDAVNKLEEMKELLEFVLHREETPEDQLDLQEMESAFENNQNFWADFDTTLDVRLHMKEVGQDPDKKIEIASLYSKDEINQITKQIWAINEFKDLVSRNI